MIFIYENIKIALRSFSSRRMRTILSILGIIIGICSVVIITSLGTSAQANIRKSISGTGLGAITLFAGRDLEDRSVLTEALAQEIKQAVPNIQFGIPVFRRSFQLRYGKNTYQNAQAIAVSPEFKEIFKVTMQQGAFISEEDNQERRQYIVLGSEVANALFSDGEAVGKYLRLFRGQTVKNFKVIGVLPEREDTMGMSFNTAVFIPHQTYKTKLYKPDAVDMYIFSVASEDQVLDTSNAINSYLARRFKSSAAFRVMSLASVANMASSVMEALYLLLTGIAAISLLVGGIGIMNIMLVSVTERTKEIGIRKAIGAPPGVIRAQFLIEAVTLTAVGGIIGLVVGNLTSLVITSFLGWPYALNIWANLLALLISSSIGIFFGYYPAVKASRLNPVEALSYE